MSDKAPPYPADTRAKGWRFELNYEQIEQSDTWDIAAEIPMAQHSLLMMWYVAWKQEPCGSFPSDEVTVRAKCKINPKAWATMRDVLMRGWWLADDGRLYHPTLTQRVLEMLEYRRKTAERVANFKLKQREQRSGNALPTGEQQDKNDTGTGTGTGTIEEVLPPSKDDDGDEVDTSGFIPTPAGLVCKALRVAGVAAVNPSNPTLLALLNAGATTEEFTAAAAKAADKSKPFEYLLTVVQNERQRAKEIAGTLHVGAMPQKAPQTASERAILQAVPGIAAPHLRPAPTFLEEVTDVSPRLLG